MTHEPHRHVRAHIDDLPAYDLGCHDEHDHGHGQAHGHEHEHGTPGGHLHDDAPHGHGHGHGHGGVGGWLRHLFTPHSHDAADSVDSALETSADGIRAVKISLVGLSVTAILQGLVVVATGSVALLADTIHNISDAATALPLWVAFVLARRAPTRRYTYGFGRAEDLAGLFVVAMIALSAVVAGYESIHRLIAPEPIAHLGAVMAAGVIGCVGNEVVASYRIRVGRRIGSAALVADGLHARTDGLTSLAVVVGAIGVWAGFPLADPLVGLLITGAILVILRGAAREIYRRLMDAVDPQLVDDAERSLAATPGVVAVEQLRLRWSGHRVLAEAGVVVDARLTQQQAHEVAHEASHRLRHAVPTLASATVHASPAGTH